MTLNSYLRKLLEGSEISAVDIVNDNATTCDVAVLRASIEQPIEHQQHQQQQQQRFGGGCTEMNRAQSLFSMVSSSSHCGGSGGRASCPTNDHLTSRWQNNISRAVHSDSTLGKPKRRGSTDTAGMGDLWNACMLAESSLSHSPPSPTPSSFAAAATADTSLVPPSRSSRSQSGSSRLENSSCHSPIPPIRSSSDSQSKKNSSSPAPTVSPALTSASTPRSSSSRRKSSHTESPRKTPQHPQQQQQQQQQRERQSSRCSTSGSSLLASLGPMAPTRRNSGTQQQQQQQQQILLPSLKQMPALQNMPQRPTKGLSRTLTPRGFPNLENGDEFTSPSEGGSNTREDDGHNNHDGVVVAPSPNRTGISPSPTSATTNLKLMISGGPHTSPSAVTQGFPKSLREFPYSDRGVTTPCMTHGAEQ
jgi:hypothetical protein